MTHTAQPTDLTTWPMAIATAPRRNAKHWDPATITWGQWVQTLEHPHDRKDAQAYLFARLDGTRRTKATVLARSAVTLDADAPDPDLLAILDLTVPYALAWHTTWSSTPSAPRYRVVIPLAREVDQEEYREVAERLMKRLGDRFDPASADPIQYMFAPACPPGGAYEYHVADGPLMDPDEVLADWSRDLSHLPAPRSFKRDPLELQGAVGAFNRAYSIAEVIDAYDLPYEPRGDRWHLIGASAQAGVVPVTEHLVYSHHANDPAFGETCSAFDLVRLHRFGALDADAGATPVNRRPSHAAMVELAMEDPAVVRAMAPEAFTVAPATDEATAPADTAHQWTADLELHPKTAATLDTWHNWSLILKHDPAMAEVYYNEVTEAIEGTDALPWRQGTAATSSALTARDYSALGLHIERYYRLKAPAARLRDVVHAHSFSHSRNPLVEHLNSLQWDGTPRVETALPGVTPTAFTRLVARKTLVAAVARAMDPGVKWDHTLVLYGSEGVGKSFWVERLAMGYSASLGPLRSKDTMLTVKRSWILLADEGHSLKMADSDVMKEFLTRRTDVYRTPYEVDAAVHPRKCVVWATTNSRAFLSRQEGNRRFWVVHCERPVDMDALTDEYVDQLWAEAVHLYRAGERLFLTKDEAALAAEAREPFTEEDPLAAQVMSVLNDMPVPAHWADMHRDERLAWKSLWDGDQLEDTEETGRITAVTSSELHELIYGGHAGPRQIAEKREIHAVLLELPGWHRVPGQRHVPRYGTLDVFERTEDIL